MQNIKRFWFEFEIDNVSLYPSGIGCGCGISAYSYQDAIAIIKQEVFKDIEMPKIKKYIENVDIRDLDKGHVIPNMKPPIYRGVWFPQIS